MGTNAVYTFKGDPGETDLHLVAFSDGYPEGAANIIPELQAVRKGENIDLEPLELPHVRGVANISDWRTCSAYSYRYEISVLDDQQVVVAFEHDLSVPKDLEERHERARIAFEEAEAAMREAIRQPKYVEIFRGEVAKLGEFSRQESAD